MGRDDQERVTTDRVKLARCSTGRILSMSGKGNRYGNAIAATVFKPIEPEPIWRATF